MNKLEIFMDVTCPFCKKGYEYLAELLPEYPNANLDWMLVEAHPRNEEPGHHPYTDQTVQSSLMLKERGLNVQAYTELLFKEVFENRADVEDVHFLAQCAKAVGLDTDEFTAALNDGRYVKAQLEQNDYAYETQKVWAVPTFVCGDIRLDSKAGVGVSKEQLKELLDKLYK